MKTIIPIPAVLDFKASVEAKLANAVAALHAADFKLGKTAAGYEDTDCLPIFTLWEAEFNARLFARMLGDTITAVPSLPGRVLHTLESYANRDARNPPHVEGGILALTLAARSIHEALDMIEQLDGDEVDAAFEVALAARGTIRSYAAMIAQAVMGFDEEAVLESILAGKRRPAIAAKRTRSLIAA